MSGIVALARLVGRPARRLAQQIAHPFRRWHARGTVGALRPTRILFVCLGNICRSPYAAARLAATLAPHLQQRISTDSAGLIGPGRPSPDIAISVARSRGLDLRDHRSRLFTPTDRTPSSLFAVMEPSHLAALREAFGVPADQLLVLGDLDPERPDIRAIPDPIEGNESVFADCFARIDRCVAALAKLVTDGSTADALRAAISS